MSASSIQPKKDSAQLAPQDLAPFAPWVGTPLGEVVGKWEGDCSFTDPASGAQTHETASFELQPAQVGGGYLEAWYRGKRTGVPGFATLTQGLYLATGNGQPITRTVFFSNGARAQMTGERESGKLVWKGTMFAGEKQVSMEETWHCENDVLICEGFLTPDEKTRIPFYQSTMRRAADVARLR